MGCHSGCNLVYVFFVKISAMREEEKLLRQKLNDADKTKKQLQSDIANRDRTIQQLKGVRFYFFLFKKMTD